MKTIDGRDYFYLQWREGDTVTSQYVLRLPPDRQVARLDLAFTSSPSNPETIRIDTPGNYVADGMGVGGVHLTGPTGTYRFAVSGGGTYRFADRTQFDSFTPGGSVPHVTAFDDEQAVTLGVVGGHTPVELAMVNRTVSKIRLIVEEFHLAPGETATWTLGLAAHAGGTGAPDTASRLMGKVPDATVPVRIGDNPPPTDPDRDGTYEDIDGDRDVDILDVGEFLERFDGEASDSTFFDVSDDGNVDILDVAALLRSL